MAEPDCREHICDYRFVLLCDYVFIKNKNMEIKVLGTGCAKCKTTYQTIEKVISENNLEDVKFTKVEDIVEILNSGIMATPAVVVDGAVKVKGHVPSEKR